MMLIENDSTAGRALELARDLVKLGRMSNAEARVIEDLARHPDLPKHLWQAGETLEYYVNRGGSKGHGSFVPKVSVASPATPPPASKKK